MSERVEMYGAFPGGDPREFTPDPECSTEAEREAHRRACLLWAAGENLGPDSPAHLWAVGADGEILAHIARCKYGIGTYWIGYDENEAAAVMEPHAMMVLGGKAVEDMSAVPVTPGGKEGPAPAALPVDEKEDRR